MTVAGDEGRGVTVEVVNQSAVASAALLPGSGVGLLGLRDRVTLLGGVASGGPVCRRRVAAERLAAVESGPRGDRRRRVGVTRVLIIDDEALVRAGLRMILESADDIDVVGEADDGGDAVEAVERCRPDMVLMDVRMPRLDGLAATDAIRGLDAAPPVVILTTFDLDDYVFRALQAGAAGFLLKDTPPLELVQAVRVVAAGESMLSPSVTRRLIAHFAADSRGARQQQARAQLAELSPREVEVFAEVGRGRSNADIGGALS